MPVGVNIRMIDVTHIFAKLPARYDEENPQLAPRAVHLGVSVCAVSWLPGFHGGTAAAGCAPAQSEWLR